MPEKEMMRSWGGLSPYEDFKISEMASRRPNGATITSLVIGSVGLVAGITAWISAAAREKGVRDLANARYDATNAQLSTMAGLLAAERNERVAQGVTMSQTITDSISGQQQGSQTQSTSVENSAMAAATSELLKQSLLGNLSENAQKVQIYSAPQPCACPGCGCNN